MNNGRNGTGAAVLAVQAHVPAPPSIDRQMLLASFAAAALTGYLAQGPTDCNRHEIAFDCFEIADVMLAQFAKRVGA